MTRQDRWLGNPDAVGTVGCAMAHLSNWANDFKPVRDELLADLAG